jgi:hypothetical protein
MFFVPQFAAAFVNDWQLSGRQFSPANQLSLIPESHHMPNIQ